MQNIQGRRFVDNSNAKSSMRIQDLNLREEMTYYYKVETHLHTSESSACARDGGMEMIRACKRLGYSAAVVTDHFFNGNCAVKLGGKASWHERVRRFALGYENAKSEGDKIGIDVYFGFEYNYQGSGTEFLIYNFSLEDLASYPEIMTDDFEKVAESVRRAGGLIIHTHPFRYEEYMQFPRRVFPPLTDAVETVNSAHEHTPQFDAEANMYAEKFGLIKIGGSDAHWVNGIKSGVAFKKRPDSLADIINMLRQGEHIILGEQQQYDLYI